VSGVVTPPAFRAADVRGGQLYTPSVAWKMTEMPDGSGVMMLHQRGTGVDKQEPILTEAGGYSGGGPCNTIVHPAVTMVSPDGTTHSGPALAGLVLAVDMAISADGQKVAIVSAGKDQRRSRDGKHEHRRGGEQRIERPAPERVLPDARIAPAEP